MERFFELTGMQVKKSDIASFLIGMVLSPVLLFILFFRLTHNGALENVNYFSLLVSGKGKLAYYLAVGFIEEFIFRGIIFGAIDRKTDKTLVSILLSACIFAIPHGFNSTAPVEVMMLFSFAFGILACEMRCLTKSIWMSTAFHWTWNYTIVSVFIHTNTNQFIYRWITIEIFVLTLLFWWLCKRN